MIVTTTSTIPNEEIKSIICVVQNKVVLGTNLVYAVEFADGKLDKGWRYFDGKEIGYNFRLIRTIKK